MIIFFNKPIVIVLLVIFLFLSTEKLAYRIGDSDVRILTSFDEIYDDNITFVKDNKKNDFITKVSLGLTGNCEGRRSNFDFLGNINHRFFSDNKNFDNNSEEMVLNCRSDFTEYDHLNVKNSFSHVYEPRSFEEIFGQTNGRYSYYFNRFHIEYTKEGTNKLSISTRYFNETKNFSRNDLDDSYLNNTGIEANYPLYPDIDLSLSYDFSKRSYHSTNPALAHSVVSGFKKYINRKFYVSGKAGANFITSSSRKKYNNPQYLFSLVNDVDEKTKTNLLFLKQYNTSSFYTDIIKQWQISGAFNRQLLKRLNFSFSVFYGEDEYISTAFKRLVFSSIAYIPGRAILPEI